MGAARHMGATMRSEIARPEEFDGIHDPEEGAAEEYGGSKCLTRNSSMSNFANPCRPSPPPNHPQGYLQRVVGGARTGAEEPKLREYGILERTLRQA